MPETVSGSPRLRQLHELTDVFGFLEQVRLRPGMWVRSLDELQSMLIGYRVALEVHGIGEDFEFWPTGAFAEWLWTKLGRHSSLGWATEIGREAEARGVSPLNLFFTFVDEFRASDRTRNA
ncbi:hypothetical protein HDA40_007213 [Hamadaea flava]|uniref:Uncharacterized protein n=1 Tax=Hamadaea flava TaxID=1742688 RepID=A0ABV8LT72_9ACTN|nr:hypothetical protein [Hamadaea flava]MCP2328706.1 hypothetical protein [Hamadaea flava]